MTGVQTCALPISIAEKCSGTVLRCRRTAFALASIASRGESAVMPVTEAALEELRLAAHAASGRAYAPYSKFHVGAAVLAESGEIFAGCNVENASYGLTICAERSAVVQAVAAGCRRLVACAVYVKGARTAMPCHPKPRLQTLRRYRRFAVGAQQRMPHPCGLRDDAADAAGPLPEDRKSTRLNSSHIPLSRMPSSA